MSLRRLLVFLLVLPAATVLGQSTGQIVGSVTDSSGAAVPAAQILLTGKLTGVQRTLSSDAAGSFVVPDLRIGSYSLKATAPGFAPRTVADVNVEVSQTTTVNITLGVATAVNEVTVSSLAPVIDRSTVVTGDVVTQKTVQEIPLNGRHFVELGVLIPGSLVAPQAGFLTSPIRGQGALAFITAGNREDTTNFLINGVNLNDMAQNQITFQPSIDTVAEFKVDNSTPDAQNGRNSGAVVNIATRSGNNELHGEVFEFLRNEKLDARNFFAPVKNPYKRNNFGAALGGPLRHDKIFYFGSYEGVRQAQGLPLNTPVLTAAQRNGVTDAAAQKLLALIPLPNDASGTRFVGSLAAPVQIDQGTGDIQANLGAADTLHGYYALQADSRIEPTLQGDNLPGFGDSRKARRQVFTLSADHIVSSATVNSLRLGFNRIHITFSPNTALKATDYGIAPGSTSPLLPFVSLAGGFALGGPAGFPQGRSDTGTVVADTLSTLRGRHYIQLGVEGRRALSNNFSATPGFAAFSSLANFQAGHLSFFSTTQGANNSDIAVNSIGGFVQDTLKLSPTLTLVGGLRYEFNQTPIDTGKRYVVVDPTNGGLVSTTSPYHAPTKQFQPRVGINWDPRGDGKEAIRAGYGIYADQPVLNSVTGLTGNPPFAIPIFAQPTATTPVLLDTPLANSKTGGISPSTIDPNFRGDYVQDWNVNLQRQLTAALGFQAGYYGSKGTHLRLALNQNEGNPYAAFGRSYGIINEVTDGGNSLYNALWFSLKQHVASGLEFDTNYTYSKSIDYNSLNSQGITVQDSHNFRNDRGPSDYDARHHFSLSGVYSVPYHQVLLKDWQISSILVLQSGNPFTVRVPGGNPVGGVAGTLRPNMNGDSKLSNPTPNLYFNPAVFSLPAKGAIGSEGRNALYGPGFNNLDFSIARNFNILERATLQFRAEFFDALNLTNFGQPIATFGSPLLGQILSTRFAPGDSGSSRQIQFGLKISF